MDLPNFLINKRVFFQNGNNGVVKEFSSQKNLIITLQDGTDFEAEMKDFYFDNDALQCINANIFDVKREEEKPEQVHNDENNDDEVIKELQDGLNISDSFEIIVENEQKEEEIVKRDESVVCPFCKGKKSYTTVFGETEECLCCLGNGFVPILGNNRDDLFVIVKEGKKVKTASVVSVLAAEIKGLDHRSYRIPKSWKIEINFVFKQSSTVNFDTILHISNGEEDAIIDVEVDNIPYIIDQLKDDKEKLLDVFSNFDFHWFLTFCCLFLDETEKELFTKNEYGVSSDILGDPESFLYFDYDDLVFKYYEDCPLKPEEVFLFLNGTNFDE
jgi:hypothetical protein